MAGTGGVHVVSSRVRPGELQRMARARVARDGRAAFAAVASSGRQRRLVFSLWGLLSADPGLDLYLGVFWPAAFEELIWLAAYPAGAVLTWPASMQGVLTRATTRAA
jgi:hypothetical protein